MPVFACFLLYHLVTFMPTDRRKNKFCINCNGKRGDLYVHASRVRGLPESLHEIVINSSEGGVWSVSSNTLGDARFRVINNTAACCLPRLVIFEKEAPELQWGLSWVPLPPNWVVGGEVHLCVSRGTLVPVADRKKLPATFINNQTSFPLFVGPGGVPTVPHPNGYPVHGCIPPTPGMPQPTEGGRCYQMMMPSSVAPHLTAAPQQQHPATASGSGVAAAQYQHQQPPQQQQPPPQQHCVYVMPQPGGTDPRTGYPHAPPPYAPAPPPPGALMQTSAQMVPTQYAPPPQALSQVGAGHSHAMTTPMHQPLGTLAAASACLDNFGDGHSSSSTLYYSRPYGAPAAAAAAAAGASIAPPSSQPVHIATSQPQQLTNAPSASFIPTSASDSYSQHSLSRATLAKVGPYPEVGPADEADAVAAARAAVDAAACADALPLFGHRDSGCTTSENGDDATTHGACSPTLVGMKRPLDHERTDAHACASSGARQKTGAGGDELEVSRSEVAKQEEASAQRVAMGSAAATGISSDGWTATSADGCGSKVSNSSVANADANGPDTNPVAILGEFMQVLQRVVRSSNQAASASDDSSPPPAQTCTQTCLGLQVSIATKLKKLLGGADELRLRRVNSALASLSDD